MGSDGPDNPLRMVHDLGVNKADDGPVHGFQVRLTEVISQNNIVETMDPAVNLDDEPEAITGEICEVAPDRMLSAKPVAVDLPAPKKLPDAAFGQSCLSALGAGENRAGAGHTAKLGQAPQQ